MATAICFTSLRGAVRHPFSLGPASAGRRIPPRMVMMAMTTRSSIRVNAPRPGVNRSRGASAAVIGCMGARILPDSTARKGKHNPIVARCPAGVAMCSPQGATGSKDTTPIACEVLGHLLEEKKIRVVHDFAIASVDSEKHRIVSWDEKEVGYE